MLIGSVCAVQKSFRSGRGSCALCGERRGGGFGGRCMYSTCCLSHNMPIARADSYTPSPPRCCFTMMTDNEAAFRDVDVLVCFHERMVVCVFLCNNWSNLPPIPMYIVALVNDPINVQMLFDILEYRLLLDLLRTTILLHYFTQLSNCFANPCPCNLITPPYPC
jgi:hypothetical protein